MTIVLNNRIRILVLGLATISVTVIVAFLLKDEKTTDARFWITWAPVLVGEVLVGAVALQAAGDSRTKITRRAAISVVPVVYVVFTLVLAAINGFIISDAWLSVFQAIGLLATLFFVVTSTMATEASERDEEATKKSLASRSSWRLELEDAAVTACNVFPDNEDIAKALADAAEKARFSPETIVGREDLDEPVRAAVQSLCTAARGPDPAAVLTAAKVFQQVADIRARHVRVAR